MAQADVITRFRLETTQYDSKLRDASKQLSEYGRKARDAGSEFQKVTKGQEEFARALGTIPTSATNAKDKVKELVGAYNEALKAYKNLTTEQQESDWGKALGESVIKLRDRVKEAKQELYSMGDAVNQVKSSGGGFDQLLGGVAGKFGMSPAMFTGVGVAVAGFGALQKAVRDNVATAMGFEKSMSGLSSLTGMVGDDLNRLKEYAIELGSTSTLTASEVADAFKMIGSQQPQLLASGEALKEVTKYAITLSEAAGIDLSTASQTLSTSINQMGGDSANAARYVNVLAAASQKGAGDIAWLGESITKAATAAKAVGTDYEELVANLEQLAKAGFDASTAGTALRSIIMNLEKQANQNFKPSVVGLTQAFDNLSQAQLDLTGYQEIAGKMFATQAKVLAEAAGEARNMEEAITGTNIAEQQAATNTDNLDGSLKSLSSAWEGLNLHLNDSNSELRSVVDWLKETIQWADKTFTALGRIQNIRDKRGSGSLVDNELEKLRNQPSNNAADKYFKETLDSYKTGIEKVKKELEDARGIFWNPVEVTQLEAKLAVMYEEMNDFETRGYKVLRELRNVPVKIDVDDSEVDDVREDLDTNKGKNGKKVSIPKTEEQQIQAQIQSLQQEYIKATEPRRAEIRVEVKGLQERQQEIQRLKDEAAGKVVVPIEYPEGSIRSMEKELSDLKKAQSNSLDNYEWAAYQQAIEETTKKIGILKGELPKGMQATYTLEVNKEQLDVLSRDGLFAEKDVRVNVELAGDPLDTVESLDEREYTLTIAADTVAAVDKVGELVKDIEHQQPVIEPKVEMPQNLETLKQSIEAALNMNDVKVDTTTFTTLLRTAVKNGISDLDGDFSELFAKIGSGLNIPDDTWQMLQDEINTRLQELGIDPIKIDFETGNVQKVEKDAKGIDKSFNAAASAVQNVGNALSNLEDPGAKVAGIIAEAVANIALGFATATSKSAGGGVFGWIAAIAGGLATMTSTIAAIHNVTGYATGGIVEGPSGVDKVPAMLTAGEVVLSHAQTNALASELEGGGIQNLSLETRISAEDIRLVLNNRGRRTGKGEYIQSNFR